MKPCASANRFRNQLGMSMVELMIALTVLAIGVLAILALVTVSMRNNNRTKMDSGGTMVAQLVIETISAQSNAGAALTITDCNNTNWPVSGVAGSGANLTSTGAIDYLSQTYAAVPANYKMQYRECGQNGQQITYDVRWNVQAMNTSSRVITVAARPLGAGSGAGSNTAQVARAFQLPVTLRTIVAPIN
jgi:type IV pilus modification protein PilV